MANNAATSWKRTSHNSNIVGSIGTTSDADYYKYTFSANDVVSFSATTAGSSHLALSLYNSAGTLLYDEKGVGTELGNNSGIFAYKISSAATYYVRVTTSNATTGSYTLSTDLAAASPPPVTSLGYDYYSFAVTNGQPLSIGIKSLTAGSLDFDLVNDADVVMASGVPGTTNFDKAQTFTPAATGTWFVRVTSSTTPDYQLTVTRGTALDTEVNDSSGSAQSLLGNVTLAQSPAVATKIGISSSQPPANC